MIKLKLGIFLLLISYMIVLIPLTKISYTPEINLDNKSDTLLISSCIDIDGIVNWWPGEGNAYDIIGENHGTMNNGATFASGKVSQAFSFDGNDENVVIDPIDIDFLDDITVEMWVKLNSMPSGIVMRFITIGAGDFVLRYDGLSSPNEYLHFYMDIDNAKQGILVEGVLQTGIFHHVAGTYNGDVMRLFLDGIEIANKSISGMVNTAKDMYFSSEDEALDGLLDEVSIYDRVLTPNEIYSIYSADSDGKCIPKETITIINPISSSSWRAGESYNIRWNASLTISYVDIEIYKGSILEVLIDNTANDGLHEWEIPSDIEAGTDWMIKISDSSNPSINDWSDSFEIFLNSISISSPTSLSSWEAGNSYMITWNSEGDIESVNIELYRGGSLEEVIAIGTSNDGSYEWHIPITIETGTTYQLKIYDFEDFNCYDMSQPFEIRILSLYSITIVVVIISLIFFLVLIPVTKRQTIKRKRNQKRERKKKVIKKELNSELKVIEKLFREKNFSRACKNIEIILKKAKHYEIKDIQIRADIKKKYCYKLEELYKIIKKTYRIEINKLTNILEMDRTKILEKFDEFPLDGDFIKIRKEDADDFIKIIEVYFKGLELIEREKAERVLVFISYSLEDRSLFKVKDIAKNLSSCKEIEEVLFCEEHTRDNFIQYMNENVGKCDVMILFCSQNSLSSEFVKDEWMAARAMKKPIIPVFLNTEDIPPILRARVGLEYNSVDLQVNIDQLHELILKKTQI